MINRKLNANLHNRFDVFRENIQTGKREQIAYAENIILDQAWQYIMKTTRSKYQQGWFQRIGVGTGTGELSASRTTLFTKVYDAACENQVYDYDVEEGWYNLRRMITIAPEQLVGSDISEVGIGDYTTGVFKTCTHALLKDMNGNIVTIEKTDTDILYIYATVYLVIANYLSPVADVDFFRCAPNYNLLVSGLLGLQIIGDASNTYDSYYSTFPQSFAAWEGEPVSIVNATEPNLGALYAPEPFDIVTLTVTPASKTAVWYYRIPVANGNSNNGIKSIAIFNNGATYGVNGKNGLIVRYPSATLIQDQIEGEQIGIGDGSNKNFKTKFPFVKSGAIVKVDGTPVSATVYTGVPSIKNIAKYMRLWGIDGSGFLPINNRFPHITDNPYDMVIENPFYASYGIDTMVVSYATVYYSDDKVNWTQGYSTGSATQTYTVDAGHKQKRYWKFAKTGETSWRVAEINCNALDNFMNVILDSAPANEAIVTIDYDTDIAAKDSNHVLDVTVTLQLGEYVPE